MPVGVVSVGDVGQERRVQNVAAGLVSPTSTDAINGSQLYQTASAINSLSNRINVNHDKAMGGVASAMDKDLDGVQFPDAPWLYDAQSGLPSRARLQPELPVTEQGSSEKGQQQ